MPSSALGGPGRSSPTDTHHPNSLQRQVEGKVREIKDEEFESFGLSQGAIQEAAESLLPEGFDPDQNIDVLPVVFNLAE